MDILSAILACSLYRDDALVRAVVQTNSHGNPYAVVDATLAELSDAPRPEPRSAAAATELATNIAALRELPLLGLMQVPASWATIYGKQLRDLFDPCINVTVGTAKLSDLDYQCARAEKVKMRKPTPRQSNARPKVESRRHCVIRKYADAIRMPEFALVVSVELEHQRGEPTLVAGIVQAPIFFDGHPSPEGDSGKDMLLFETTAESALVDPFAPATLAEFSPRKPR
jgi:hypothetical protein